jgi:putative transcriptional regulator
MCVVNVSLLLSKYYAKKCFEKVFFVTFAFESKALFFMTTYETVESGKLLLAEPFLDDPYFRRAVILLTQHQSWGTIGFILNRPLEDVLVHQFAPLPEVDLPLYYGGPVATSTLHFIHSAGDLVDDSVLIGEKLWWGGNFEQLKFLLTSKLLPKDEVRFFVGYSGWDAGQLKGEFDEKTWIVAAMDKNYLHKFPAEALWSSILKHQSDALAVIADMPVENRFN